MTLEHRSDHEIRVHSEIMGQTLLLRFDDRRFPWHVTCHGRNYATVEDCLDYLRECERHWHDDGGAADARAVCHGEMTHSFLAFEAALDASPY